MKSILDQSHCTVLANFETLQRAQQCAEEIKDYVWDVLREVEGDLPQSDNPQMQFKLDKAGWLQANAFPKWQGTDFELISIGIENFNLTDLIASDGAKGCRAFIYSVLLADPKRLTEHVALRNQLRGLQPPPGFVLASPVSHGYLFVKKLDALSAESVCTRPELTSYFADPLNELASWLVANRATIEALGQKSGTGTAIVASEEETELVLHTDK